MGQAATAGKPEIDVEAIITGLMERGRKAMTSLKNADQARVDEAVTALAWSIYKPENAKALAEMAVQDTGLGNVDSKIIKNQRKTFGTLRDLMRAKTVGIIEEDPARGLVKYGKPVGVVAAICPSTNPAATPVNKAMMAIKGANAVIIAPSPAGLVTSTRTVDLMRQELEKAGFDPDLVQVLPSPVNKALTHELMRQVDLIVCTGSQNNVRQAYSSGTPAIGVGAGNVPVIIDTGADYDDAAEKICMSKIFDNSTSCSSENSLVIVEDAFDDAIAALKRAGGYLANATERQRILNTLWVDGKLNRHVIAKDAPVLAEAFGLGEEAKSCKFFMAMEEGVGDAYPLSDEKLSLVLTVYKVKDFDAAVAKVDEILAYKGAGHSCGIHTKDMAKPTRLAEELDVVRVLVNQAHTFGNGGSFNNGLNFTLSMGCGTWAGNSISENLNYRHFINVTHLVKTVGEDKPSEEELFGKHWSKYGQ